MHIAVDLDNTLLDTSRACIQIFNRLTGTILNTEDACFYRYYEFYGWNEEMYESVYERFGHEIHWTSTPYPDAVDIVSHLYSKYQLTIMTARPELFSKVTLEWLRLHRVPFHEIVFEQDKFSLCQRLNVDVLIDDAPHYAEEFSAKGKQFMIMDQPYNRYLKHELIHRVTWDRVIGSLTNLSELKFN